MASAGSAYVDILPEFGDFSGQILSELASIDGTIEVGVEADAAQAQAEIDSLDGGTIEADVDANVGPAEQQIEGLDGGTTEVEVQANTDPAQEQIGSLS